MKKVTILLSISQSSPNGLSSFVRSFVGNERVFMDNGIDLNVFSKDAYCKYNNSNKLKQENKRIIREVVMNLIRHSSFLSVIYDYFMESRSARIIVDKYLATDREDELVHCQEYQTCYYLLKRRPNQKVILTIHSNGEEFSMHYTSNPGLNSWFGRKYLYHRFNFIMKHVAGIGHVSRKSQEVFADNHPEFDRNKLYYVYNGIPLIDYCHKIHNEKLRFICVGSLSDRKNQLSLVKAISLLSECDCKKMELILVGDGEAREGIEKYIKQHNIYNVVLKGSCTNVDKLLKEADVFILASKDEGLPISIIEAMREGLPIIGSRVAGIPEQIVDAESGYIIETSPESIAESMKKFICITATDIESMGHKSYQHFTNHFTEDIMFRDYIALYQNLFNNVTKIQKR